MSEAYQIGGCRTDTLTGKVAIIMQAYGVGLNAAGVCFQRAAANYQVTAGKTFYVTGIRAITQSNSASDVVIRYADNAALTTTPVDLGYHLPTATAITVGQFPLFAFFTSVPAGKFVGIFEIPAVAVNAAVEIHGYEV